MSELTTGMTRRAAWLLSHAALAVFLAGTLLASAAGWPQPAAADPQPGSCRGGGSPRDWGSKCGTLFVCAFQDATSGPLPATVYSFTVTDLTSGGSTTVGVPLGNCVSPGRYRIGTAVQVRESVPPGQQVSRIDGFGASPVQANLPAATGTVTLSEGVSEVHFYNAVKPAG